MVVRYTAVLLMALLIMMGGLVEEEAKEPEKSSVTSSDTYPSWFVNPPPASDSLLWSTGCTKIHRHSGGDDAARSRNKAYENVRRAHHHILVGERLYESRYGYAPALRGQRFTVENRPDTLTSVTYRDSVQAAEMSLMLASWNPREVDTPIDTAATSFSSTSPSWVNTSGIIPGRAVGIATMYYQECKSWEEATEKAYEQLAIQTEVDVQVMTRSHKERTHGVYRVRTAARVRRARTVARWSDGDYVYVLLQADVQALSRN